MFRISITLVFLLHSLLVAGALLGVSISIIWLENTYLSDSVAKSAASDVGQSSFFIQNQLRGSIIRLHDLAADLLREQRSCFDNGESVTNILPNSSVGHVWDDLFDVLFVTKQLIHVFEAKRDDATGNTWSACGCRVDPVYGNMCQISTPAIRRGVGVSAINASAFSINYSSSMPLDEDMLITAGSHQQRFLSTIPIDSAHFDLPTACLDCPTPTLLIPISLCISNKSVNGAAGYCDRAIVTEYSGNAVSAVYGAAAPTPDSIVLLYDRVGGTVLLSNDVKRVGMNLSKAIPPEIVSRLDTMFKKSQIDVDLSIGGKVLSAAQFSIFGLSLAHVQLVPRSHYFAILDEQIWLAKVISIPIFVFICIISVVMFLAIRMPLKHVARNMTRASLMIAPGLPINQSLLFLSEVAEVEHASLLLHRRLIELKAFVPMNLFVERKDRSTSDDQSSQHSDQSLLVPSDSSCPNVPHKNPLSVERKNNNGSNSLPEPPKVIVEVSSPLDPGDKSTSQSTLSLPSFSQPTTRHSSAALETGTNWALSSELLNNNAGDRGFVKKSFSIVNIQITYDWASITKGAEPNIATAEAGEADVDNMDVSPPFFDELCSPLKPSKNILGEHVASALDPIIKAVYRCGGVLEVLRPDIIIASFGAHAQYNSSHQLLAARCALMIRRMMPLATLNRSIIALDSGDYYIGTCGNSMSAARVVFGERFNLGRKLSRMGHSEFGRILMTESIAVPLLEEFTIIPIDCILTSEFSFPTTVYELLPKSTVGKNNKTYLANLARFKLAFSQMRSGRLLVAEATLLELKDEVYPHAERLAATIRAFRSQNGTDCIPYIRREQPPFESFALQTVRTSSQGKASPHSPQLVPLHMNGENTGSSDSKTEMLKIETLRGGGEEGANRIPEGALGSDGALFQMLETDQSPDGLEPPFKISDKVYGTLTRSMDIIGSGSFSKVYRGLSSTGTLVALKYVDLSVRYVDEADLVTEVNTACKLHHENIVNHMSWVVADRYLVIVMEYVPGGSLKSILNGFGKLSIAAVRRYLLDTLKGLDYLHRQGIVHCDVKPQNLLMAMDGKCKLSDFGSCVRVAPPQSAIDEDLGSPKLSKTDVKERDCYNLRGTVIYMSPEVARGDEPTFVSDIWSLGITVYELLTGTLPWQLVGEGGHLGYHSVEHLIKNQTMFLQHICRGLVDARMDGPAGLLLVDEAPAVVDFISQCLQTDPLRRPSAAELLLHCVFL